MLKRNVKLQPTNQPCYLYVSFLFRAKHFLYQPRDGMHFVATTNLLFVKLLALFMTALQQI